MFFRRGGALSHGACAGARVGASAGVSWRGVAYRVCRVTNRYEGGVYGKYSFRLFIPPNPVSEQDRVLRRHVKQSVHKFLMNGSYRGVGFARPVVRVKLVEHLLNLVTHAALTTPLKVVQARS